MTPKKSQKASIEQNRFIYFESGIILALALLLIAFEWPTEKQNQVIATPASSNLFTEEIIRTVRKEEPRPPAPPIAPEITIVENKYVFDEPDWNFSPEVGILEGLALFPIEPEDEPAEPSIFVSVQNMPTFLGGGIADFQRYVQSHINYPRQAIDLQLQGRVYVQFVVDEKGQITQAQITRSIDPILDNAVLSALDECPRWKPGLQHGRPAKVLFSIPVNFILQ